MSFVSTDPPSQKGKTNTWLTPLPLIKSLGVFDLDPCGFNGHKTANKIIYLPEDGFNYQWEGRVWLNPPYGKEQRLWMDKMLIHGNGIALLFARLETNWIQPYIKNGFFQLQGRVKFLNEKFKEESSAGAPSMLIPFGRKNIGSILMSDLKGKWFQ